MTSIKLPYLQVYRSGKLTYAYYRRSGQRIRITTREGSPLAPGDPSFVAAYTRIHESFDAPATPKVGHGTLAHLIEHYRKSPEFLGKAEKTRKDYTRYLDLLKEKHGHLPVRTMPRDFVLALRDKYAETPRKANYLMSILRLLFSYAMDRPSTFGVTTNPAAKPKMLKTGDGHQPWEEADVERFRKRWLVGTWERTAFELALNTGQRGGDVLAMTRNHITGGVIRVAQSKTAVRVEIPISRDLQQALTPWLESHPHLALLGKMGVDRFRHRMAKAYADAGISNAKTHGLRYTAATRLRELGLDWVEIGALTGHQTAEMARKYSEQRRRAKIAITRLNDATRDDGSV